MQEIAKQGQAARSAAGAARWSAYVATKDKGALIVLRQCLLAYDRDPASFRDWLLAKLGQNTAVAAE